jgi:hypothetical protein
MNVALILVSLGIANAPLPIGHPLVTWTHASGQLIRLSFRLPGYPDVRSILGSSLSAYLRSQSCRRS